MIIVKIQGGRGNQLFQYATGRALALRHNTSLALDISAYKTADRKREFGLDELNVTYTLAPSWKKFFSRRISEQGVIFDSKILELPNNVCLEGYFPHFEYFSDFGHTIRQEITLKQPQKIVASPVYHDIQNTLSVAIHVRRTDYTRIKNESGSLALPIDYYLRAIASMRDKYPDSKFFIFSDDIAWCKENFPPSVEFYFVNENRALSDCEEFIIMSQCKHQIIANSTLSAWAGWLNPNPHKIIITPKDWGHPTNPSLPEWIRI